MRFHCLSGTGLIVILPAGQRVEMDARAWELPYRQHAKTGGMTSVVFVAAKMHDIVAADCRVVSRPARFRPWWMSAQETISARQCARFTLRAVWQQASRHSSRVLLSVWTTLLKPAALPSCTSTKVDAFRTPTAHS